MDVLKESSFLLNSRDLCQPQVRVCILVKLVDQTDQYAESVLNPQFTMISGICSIKSYLEEDVLKQKYLVDKLSVRQISQDLLCSKSTVIKYLQIYSIEPRRRGPSTSTKPNPAYGERHYGNRIVTSHDEQKVIHLMLRFRQLGYSYRKIAQKLNELKISTRQGSEWHHEVVRSVVKRAEQK